MKKRLPGTLWLNRGRWNWKVKLPGSDKRMNYPLRMPGQQVALPEGKRDLAVSVAWRIWEKASRVTPARMGHTVEEAAAAWVQHAEVYYRHQDGTPTREHENCELAIRLLRSMYGEKYVDDLTYQDVLMARNSMVEDGLARTTVNKRTGAWHRWVKWCLENRLCSPATVAEVTGVGRLKPHRSNARETDPILPVSHLTVKRTLPYLPPTLQAMVRFGELTGARPAEVCQLRGCDIDMRREVWIYRPEQHKTLHRGRPRIIAIGPRAQEAVKPYLEGDQDVPIFSPAQAVKERKTAARAARKSPVQPSQMNRSKESPQMTPGACWKPSSFGYAIRRASLQAARDGVIAGRWHPNQLRHACGTRVRRKFGPESASAVLGHSTGASRVTNIYTREAIERELITITSRIMRVIG